MAVTFGISEQLGAVGSKLCSIYEGGCASRLLHKDAINSVSSVNNSVSGTKLKPAAQG